MRAGLAPVILRSPVLDRSFMGATINALDTFTRASTGWSFNSSGSLASSATNAARFDYNPSTLTLIGLLMEPARTNVVRNTSGTGSVAGTPGTFPTNWNITTTGNGVTRTMAAAQTETGITTTEVQYAGTPTSSSSKAMISDSGTNPSAAALAGQSWSASWFIRASAGSMTNTSITMALTERTVAGATVLTTNIAVVPTSAALATQLSAQSRLFADGTTAFVTTSISVIHTINLAMDVTLRVFPQLELGAFATSPIPTTTVAVTRAVDALAIPLLTGNYRIQVIGGTVSPAGTIYEDTIAVTGNSWPFAWPAAAITAGERHLQRIRAWKH